MLLIEHSRDRSDEFPGAGSWMQNEMLQGMLNTKMASTSRITLENPSLFFSTATQPRGFVGFTKKKNNHANKLFYVKFNTSNFRGKDKAIHLLG